VGSECLLCTVELIDSYPLVGGCVREASGGGGGGGGVKKFKI